jgi:hypothetical protein
MFLSALEVAGKARQWIGPGEVANMTLGGIDVLHLTFAAVRALL